MELEQLNEIIGGFIRENFLIGRPADFVGGADSLLEKGVLDSTGILQVVAFLEESLGIKVDDEDIVPENLETIDNIVQYAQRKLRRATQCCKTT